LNKSKIKICGIKDIETIDCCIKNKVNFFGLIFYSNSPRNISLEKAQKLIKYSEKKKIRSVSVFVNENIENLNRLLNVLKTQYIQLHGDETNTYIKAIKKNKVKIIKKISIKSSNDLADISKFPDADMFLFDYKPNKKELPGGNAKSFDWQIIKNIKIEKPWFLSGGIHIENINDIKKFVIPYGIDISSGVEDTFGVKNHDKITSLIRAYEFQ
jgi:phosphoribosylanthranilate isomerase